MGLWLLQFFQRGLECFKENEVIHCERIASPFHSFKRHRQHKRRASQFDHWQKFKDGLFVMKLLAKRVNFPICSPSLNSICENLLYFLFSLLVGIFGAVAAKTPVDPNSLRLIHISLLSNRICL